MKKSIGILGGMGPLATADLFQKIIALTDATRDQDHIRVYIDNNPAVPDRTAALLRGGPDPLPEMERSLRVLEGCGADCIILPCNTAHAWLPRLQERTGIPILSILTATAEACAARFPGRTAALLGTEGTLAAGLYQQALAKQHVPFLTPDAAEQAALMRVIYDGVKAGREPETCRADFLSVTEAMRGRGADYFVLGCTELPPAAAALGLTVPTVDPTEELARCAVRFCGYAVREQKPLQL